MTSKIESEIDKKLSAASPSTSHSFHELIRDNDPAAMEVAQDLLLDRGWKMREVTGGLHARNFTIELNPIWGPRDEWKMVQTNVADADIYRKPGQPLRRVRTDASGQMRGHRTDAKGRVWIKMSVANGSVRMEREREIASSLDDAKRIAVANAWAVAKELKKLPLDAGKGEVEKIVDRHFTKKTQNLKPVELF
jgi:hypothetical protein